jgi:hypothetical protein
VIVALVLIVKVTGSDMPFQKGNQLAGNRKGVPNGHDALQQGAGPSGYSLPGRGAAVVL